MQPGLSITSLSTGINTPALPEFIENESLKMTVEEAVNAIKVFHTALTNWSSKLSSSHSQGNDCSRSGLPLNTEEEDLLQKLLTVPTEQNHRDAGTQLEQNSTRDPEKKVNDDLVTEITMPMEVQRYLKHFAIAKTESFQPIYVLL